MSIKRKKLGKIYLDLYKTYKRVSVINNVARTSQIYNGLLHDFLTDCQKKRFVPSKDFVSNKCLGFSEQAEAIAYNGGIIENTINVIKIDEALQCMIMNPALCVRELSGDKDYLYYYLEVTGIIPLAGLSPDDIVFLESAFNKKAVPDGDYIEIKLLKMMASNKVAPDLQDQINDMCMRVARDLFSRHSVAAGHQKTFKYSILDKIKDKYLQSKI